MKYTVVNDEVLYTSDTITKLAESDMAKLSDLAAQNPRKRVRLCTHENPESLLHEMFIIHRKDTYVRPHRHMNKDESFHVLAGEADIVFFDEQGNVSEAVRLGDYASGAPFYCRIPKQVMHMVIIRSEILVFCEATLGPFNREEMDFAVWAPEDGAADTWEYVDDVSRRIATIY